MKSSILATYCAALLFCVGQASGAVFAEVGDAGETLATAQETTGASPLTSITGTISSSTDADLFLIFISSPGTFSATTVGTAGTLADTQLFLFSASGLGVIANDDFVDRRSTLPAGNLNSPTTPGLYYLGVSGFDNDPVSVGGEIFPDSFSGVFGPTGPGGASPLTGFVSSSSSGTYRIDLTGAEPATIPEPSTLVLVGLGLAGLGLRMRRRSP